MQEFYKKSLLALILLVCADALLAVFFTCQSYLSLPLLPPHGPHWHFVDNNDASQKGKSTVRIDASSRERLRFDFKLTDDARYPFVSAGLLLDDGKGMESQMDWTKYSSVSFVARCDPVNSLMMSISTFDESLSKPGNFFTYRSPGTYFSCNASGAPVSLDLTRLRIEQWWFEAQHLDFSHQGYRLNRVAKIIFGSSLQSPHLVDSHVEIGELTLHGRDYRYIKALAAVLLSSVVIFAIGFFYAYSRALTASLNAQVKKDMPLLAYRQLTLEPYKDREKASVLRFIATNYTNTKLDLEAVVAGTGTNRNKVNEVLKTELGMTFISYLNKLRLTEAARLLAEESATAVAEIAYSVGYSNVPYFNKLFKEEYGCTPKTFRSLAGLQDKSAGCGIAAAADASADGPG